MCGEVVCVRCVMKLCVCRGVMRLCRCVRMKNGSFLME